MVSSPGARDFASWGSRAGAVAIDALVLLVPAVVLFLGLVGNSQTSPDRESLLGQGIGQIFVAWAIAYALYAPALMARRSERNGQTLGKRMMGIRVVREDGAPYRYGSALLREVVVKALLWVPFLPAIIVDYLWPLVDGENRALHDKLVSSHVVRA